MFLAQLGFRVVGVDIVEAAVQLARARAQAAAGVEERCVFVRHDVLQLPAGFGWEAARKMEQQQVEAGEVSEEPRRQQRNQQQHDEGLTKSASPSPPPQGQFDLIVDCQTFHVLWEQDAAAAIATLARLLKPGGLLMLLTGNANEEYCGPNVVTEQQLRSAFSGSGGGGGGGGGGSSGGGGGEVAAAAVGWEFVWLTQSRFDETAHYKEVLGKRPLAWWALLRRL